MSISRLNPSPPGSRYPRPDSAMFSLKGESEVIGSVRDFQKTLGKLLRAVGGVRVRRDLTADEVLVILAVGYLGISDAHGGLRTTPVSCQDVSHLLKIPRETVRRKAARLLKKDLLVITPQGLLIEDIAGWRRLVDDFAT